MAVELTRPPASVLRSGKLPGQQEIADLIELLPCAALVVDLQRETILLANNELSKLTAYAPADLQGVLINSLIPEVNLSQLGKEGEMDLTIQRHKREPLEISAQLLPLGASGRWLLLKIEPQAARMSPAQMREIFLRSLLDLSRLIDEGDIKAALARAVDITGKLFNTDLVCIYQADGGFPSLTKAASLPDETIFPDTVSSSDLIRLSTLTVWLPGKRVMTEIHRYGRIANLTSITTVPLGLGKAIFGLLVIGNAAVVGEEMIPGMAEIVGSYISLAVQYFLLSENLRQEIEKYDQLLTTHHTVFDSSSEGIIVLSPELTIRELNPAAEWMLGYANWEAKDQPVENILIGPERLIPALESARGGIPTHNIGNVNLHRRSGQSFPAHLQTIPVQQDGRLLAVIVFLTDVSIHEEFRMRTQQLEHRAVLGDVTAVFAHEVRNPINNISTGLQLMSSRLRPEDPSFDIVSRMENDCARLNHLMESVLAFSRPVVHKNEPVDVGILLQRLLDRWRPRMTRVSVEPFFQTAGKIPPVAGDLRALEQVFTNLVSNAVEAMNKNGGTLAVRIGLAELASTPPQVEITVSDNGPGIPDEIRERIFEPFITSKQHGTGLGLAITKRIVTAHHGSIKLESFPGGTVFRVFLPVYQGD